MWHRGEGKVVLAMSQFSHNLSVFLNNAIQRITQSSHKSVEHSACSTQLVSHHFTNIECAEFRIPTDLLLEFVSSIMNVVFMT